VVNNNDDKILKLKKQIDEKKINIGKSRKFTPVTNCSIELDGVRHNIQVLSKDQIVSLVVKLNSYAMAAKELDLLEQYNINGYNVNDWIADLKAKYDFINRRDEEQKLKAMESKLDLLLSNEKKVEIEINEIEALLK